MPSQEVINQLRIRVGNLLRAEQFATFPKVAIDSILHYGGVLVVRDYPSGRTDWVVCDPALGLKAALDWPPGVVIGFEYNLPPPGFQFPPEKNPYFDADPGTLGP